LGGEGGRGRGLGAAWGQSLVLGLVGAGAATLLSPALAWFIARHSFRGKAVMSLAIWLPWAIPGVLLGTAFLTVFLNVPGLRLAYGTAAALITVLTVQGLPFPTHMFQPSLPHHSPHP